MAQTLAGAPQKQSDGVCFHCQQSAEKFLKALLSHLGQDIPRTHHLRDLQRFLLSPFPDLKSLERGLVFLTQFAVEVSYPGKNATRRQGAAALRWAGRVRRECRALLGIKPGGPSKKR
jgi:HEPN domain-containing protein